MTAPPAGIAEADWTATPANVRQIVAWVQALRDQNDQLRAQITAVATELAELRERIGRNSPNSSRPPSSDGPGFQTTACRKGSGRNRGAQQGHAGSGPELLPVERCSAVVEHHPRHCRRCGTPD